MSDATASTASDTASNTPTNAAFNIAFLCTGNSARSIMAEMAANHPTIGLGKLRGLSAGSQPTGQVHPVALATLQRHGIDVSGAASKSWNDFAGADAPRIDFLITVCDNAAAETCPIWPGLPTTAHWGVPDPAAAPEPEQAAAFEAAFLTLRRRIELFASLPLASLDGMRIREHAERIARETTD